MKCSLCDGNTTHFYQINNRRYVKCNNCNAILLLPESYLKPAEEKARYSQHNNDIKDPRYQNFVSPITSHIIDNFPSNVIGLDYGCGTGPVAAIELRKQGFTVNLYDPFFEDHPEVLNRKYHFIICCEVMEHFHDPYGEFKLLSDLLLPGGKLYCKTSLYLKDMDFEKWYYKNDPTHVIFYTPQSLEWIRANLGFKDLNIDPKLIIFTK